MTKALRYLKPFWLSVIAVIALVFAQVQCELALPDYMSGIVTNGIQYGGITDSIPSALTADDFTHMKDFMEEADIAAFEHAYRRREPGTAAAYPLNQSEPIYELSESSGALEQIVSLPFAVVSFVKTPQFLASSGLTSPDQLYANSSKEDLMAMRNSFLSSSGITEDTLPAMVKVFIKAEYAALGINTERMQNRYILQEGMIMLLITLLGSFCAAGSSYLSSRTATGACRNMRADVFKKVESFSSEEFSRFSTASLITRTTNDIQQVQVVITMLLRIVLFAPLMGLTSLVKVMRYRSMAGILGWVILFIIAILIIAYNITMPKFRIIQKLVDRLNLVTREQLSGMLVIRAFNNQKAEEQRFDEVNSDITKVNIFVNRALVCIMPMMTFLMSSVSILIIWFGARQIDLGSMEIGEMMAFLQYSIHVLMSFMIVAMIFILIPRSSVSARRVFEVLETEPSILDPEHPEEIPAGNQTIRFNDVSFRYPKAEEYVLRHISFEARPGETIAVIGSTGSGKSTLVNLIPRFFDVSEGSITFGGTDIRSLRQKDLRERIGYVPQKSVLFSGTVESNLRYADEDASEETMQRALDISQSSEFVNKMPHGIEEPISQGGTNVSGGQKQRLSIARALTRNAQVYIFDDSFSALDFATDAKLRRELGKLIEATKATVLIVAQRISSITGADKIIVLENGEIAGMGTHRQLLETCKVYQEIAYSQLSREELA